MGNWEHNSLASWFRGLTLLLAWFAASINALAGTAQCPSFEVDPQRHLRETTRLTASGGHVWRAHDSRPRDSAGLAAYKKNSDVAAAQRQSATVEILEGAHFAGATGLLDEVSNVLGERPGKGDGQSSVSRKCFAQKMTSVDLQPQTRH